MIFCKRINEDFSVREEHEAAHELLFRSIEKFYGISSPRIEKGEHGKPFFPEHPEIFFNISHCRGLVVCGFSDSEIGVDAELIRDHSPRVMDRVFSGSERETVLSSENRNEMFFRFWTLKEALGKCLGTGVFCDMKPYSFELSGERPVCAAVKDKIFFQKIIYEKWVVSVCTHDPKIEFIFEDQ